jgi:hypothetical protein
MSAIHACLCFVVADEAPDTPDDRTAAEAYNYVPFSVLGDYHFDVEPDWLGLPQMEPAAFLAGLRQRNWTCTEFK